MTIIPTYFIRILLSYQIQEIDIDIVYLCNTDILLASSIGEIYKTTPDSSREVSELYEFIDKVKQSIDAALFTINMAEKPLSEVADFLEMFVPEVKVPESVQSKSVALQVEKKTMKGIISDLGLEVSGIDK